MHNHQKALEVFRKGTVIPATPLTITEDRKFDPDTLRVLMKYYLNCGVGGIATAVHSTQFEIRQCGMFEPVIKTVSEEVDKFEEETGKSIFKICAACGPTEQAVKEAQIAKSYGYDAILLSPGGLNDKSEAYLLDRAQQVGQILPVVGFYLQTAVGGRVLSYDFWLGMANTENVIGFKCASFNRYTTVDVMRAVANSRRFNDITMYTGNDDNIVSDLISDFVFGEKTVRFTGGLLGHWCLWTKKAVELLDKVREARKTGDFKELLTLGAQITDMNRAAFDSVNNFKGCIPGIHEVLRRQGLMKNNLCLNPNEVLSEGQAEELDRVTASYPHLVDDDFIKENIEKWRKK